MVGDGVNDAAALATADLGIAMGAGATSRSWRATSRWCATTSAAADAIRLSRRTLAVIKGNLFWAFAYNVAAIPLAALGLLNPMLAGAAMALSSLFVVTNSLRLRCFRDQARLRAGTEPGSAGRDRRRGEAPARIADVRAAAGAAGACGLVRSTRSRFGSFGSLLVAGTSTRSAGVGPGHDGDPDARPDRREHAVHAANRAGDPAGPAGVLEGLRRHGPAQAWRLVDDERDRLVRLDPVPTAATHTSRSRRTSWPIDSVGVSGLFLTNATSR